MAMDAGELESIDYEEATEILSSQEQREKWEWELSKGLIDEADILMQMNPDGYQSRDDALEYLSERGAADVQPEETSPLSALLTRPV